MDKKETGDLNKSEKISLFPYNGRSNYLIDKFYIIGYNTPTINKIISHKDFIKNILAEKQKNKSIDDEKSLLQSFHLNEEPIFLNEISSDYSKECLPYETIKEMILPNKINLYYLEEDESVVKLTSTQDTFEQYEQKNTNGIKPNSYNVVFSSNPQEENNSKKSINGFAYVFYNQLIKKVKYLRKYYTLYIPTIFCVISEFPYYNSFYKLCLQIKSLFNYKLIEVPIEIMLHNIINYTLSPINRSIILSIEPFNLQIMGKMAEAGKKRSCKIFGAIQEENEGDEDTFGGGIMKKETFTKKKKYSEPNVDFTKFNSYNKLKDGVKVNEQYSTEITNSEFTLPDNIGNRHRKTRQTFFEKPKKIMDELLPKELNKIFPKITFDFLPGYPLIQYNLAKVLLNTLSPYDIITVFLYTFLEKDVLFFSKDIEYLSLTINTYLNLNYPFNDEKYYFSNASVSFDNFYNNNSQFVGSTFTTILGINDKYQSKYMNGAVKLKEHLVVDLDKC